MLKATLSVLILLASCQAGAVIDVLPKLIEVKDTQPITVNIVNKSEHTEYVSVTLSRLLNPGVPYEQEQLEPVGMSREPQLYAYPFRLSLAQGQSKTIVLKPLNAVDKETVYRLDIKPVMALSGEPHVKTVAGVAISLSFSTLVRQLPAKQSSDIAISCREQGVMLTATGTVRYKVESVTKDGKAVDAFNVYPGTPVVVAGRDIAIAGKKLCS